MKKTACRRIGWGGGVALIISAWAPLVVGCASDQKSGATAEQVRDGEALPPAPPVPAEPASTESPASTPPRDSATTATAPSAEPPAKEALTEAQIAKVSELVNTAEVEQGKLAQSKAKAPGVKRFADMMVKHHGEALKAQVKLVKKLKVTAADSAIAATLKADSDDVLAKLKTSDANEFDAAYVKSQIDGHEKVLDLLDTQLIPSAKTPDVLNALHTGRAIVEQHLKDARALR